MPVMDSSPYQRLSVKQALLSLVVALVLSITITLVGAMYYLGQSRDNAKTEIEYLLQAVHPAASAAVFHLDTELSGSVVEGLLEFPVIARATIRDETKDILAQDRKKGAEFWYGGLAEWAYGAIAEQSVLLSHSDYPRDIGSLHVQLNIDHLAAQYLQRVILFLITALVISSLLAVVLGVIFYRLLTRPLMQISEAVLTATPGSGQAFTHVQHIAQQKDELGQLVAALTSQFQRFENVLTERTNLATQLHIRNASIAAMDSAFVIIDATCVNHPIIDVNPAFEAMTGYTQDEITGKSLDYLHGNDTADEEINALQDALAQGSSYYAEIVNYKKDGSLFWNDLSLDTVRDERGNILYSVVIMRDVTEWRNAEDLWRRSQKMDAIGKMAGGIAHDFNNILAIILGHVELLIESAGDQPRLKISLESIYRAGQRAAALTKRLLQFSRTDIGTASVSSVDTLVRNISDMLARSLTPEISIEYELKSDPQKVLINPGDLEDAILNLCINSRNAISGAGTITIATDCKILQAGDAGLGQKLSPGAYVRLSIRDSGCGMSPETIERVFEPFFTTKELSGGTGLGLSQVYGFVSRSRGDVQVQSEIGVGSKFLLYLPVTEQVLEPLQKKAETPPLVGGDETILVVDDEAELVYLARQALCDLGYRVLVADNVHVALEIFEDNLASIDLLISDVVMPELNGYELAAKMCLLKPQLPVLFVSGFSADIHPGPESERLNLHRLSKPYTNAELSGAVRTALDSDG